MFVGSHFDSGNTGVLAWALGHKLLLKIEFGYGICALGREDDFPSRAILLWTAFIYIISNAVLSVIPLIVFYL